MKKYYAQAFFAVAILVGAAFIACDDEDHTSAATTFEKMEMDFSYEVSPDLLEVPSTFTKVDSDQYSVLVSLHDTEVNATRAATIIIPIFFIILSLLIIRFLYFSLQT